MAKKYIFVRMPEDTYKLYQGIKINMEQDIKNKLGKDVKMPMTKVFKAVASPEINENYIQIDLKDLIKLARRRK